MEYHFYAFSQPAAGYFHHHYNALFIRRGDVGVPAAMVDSVWVVNPPAYGGNVDGNWILDVDDAATMRQTRTHTRFEPISGTTLGRWINVQDDTWVLDSHDQEAASNDNTKHYCVSNFLETRTSSGHQQEEEEICVVCQQDLGTNLIATLDCRHRYHVHCIKTWLTLKNFCPICKAPALITVE